MQVSRFTWPEMTSIGMESVHAPKTPLRALMPPGPGGDTHDPGILLTPRIPSAAMAQACSWCWQMGDARFLAQGVVEVHGAAARHHEDVAHASLGQMGPHVVGEFCHGSGSLLCWVAGQPRLRPRFSLLSAGAHLPPRTAAR